LENIMNMTAKKLDNVLEVWQQFKATGCKVLRNKLVEHYLQCVRYNAERVHSKLPVEVELDDVISVGMLGIMDAIDSFDLTRGVKFETYCAPRIRGAILDELRAMDWVPRLVRSRTTKMDKAKAALANMKIDQPTEDQLREQLGVGHDEFNKIRSDSTVTASVSLSRKWFETDSSKDVREIDMLEDKTVQTPDSNMAHADMKQFITKGMNRQEKVIISLYYYEDMTMREIGKALDLSESRVSQMHSSLIARMRANVQPGCYRGQATLDPQSRKAA
jgi:RNA polymerase sigma factor for flagellar operon FliA